MSQSKAAREKLEVVDGLTLIWESRSLYAEILSGFREFHDVSVHSNLFSDDTIAKADQCAVDFRQMSLDTVTVAERVSNQWLDFVITFFESIDDFEDQQEIVEQTKLLSAQAKELASCFKLIAAWARDLAGRFHKAQDGTVQEVEEFKRMFQAAKKRGEEIKEQTDRELQKYKEELHSAQDVEFALTISAIALSSVPVFNIAASAATAYASRWLEKAEELEKEAFQRAQEATDKLDKLTSENKKAQVPSSYVASYCHGD